MCTRAVVVARRVLERLHAQATGQWEHCCCHLLAVHRWVSGAYSVSMVMLINSMKPALFGAPGWPTSVQCRQHSLLVYFNPCQQV